MEAKNQTDELHWFVLKTIFSREMRVKRLLDERAIESFIPMQYKIKTKFGKKEKVLIPVIKDLIFVHAEKKRVEEFKKELFLREGFEAYFLTRKEGVRFAHEFILNSNAV